MIAIRLTCTAGFISMLIAGLICAAPDDKGTPSSPRIVPLAPGKNADSVPQPEPFDAAAFFEPHRQQASQRTTAAIQKRIEEVEAFFQEAQQGTEPFVAAALGWSSKWALVVDHLPRTGSGRHERFLRDAFEKEVFSEHDLKRVLEQAVSGLIADLENIENQMLVDIRADLVSRGRSSIILEMNDEQLRAMFDDIIKTSARHARHDAAADVVLFASSVVIERILTKVLISVVRKGGTSAVVLGTGAAGGAASLGASLAIAIVVDQILSMVWDRLYDPHGRLQAEVDQYLRTLREHICEGSDADLGLRKQLHQHANARAHYYNQAILATLNESVR